MLTRTALLALALASVYCHSAQGQTRLLGAARADATATTEGREAFAVEVDPGAARNATALTIELPDGPVTFPRTAFEMRDNGGYRWHGRVDARNELLVTSDGRHASIHIRANGERWSTHPAAGGYRLMRTDMDATPPPDAVRQAPLAQLPAHTQGGGHWNPQPQEGEPVAIIDFWIMYTEGARDGAGGDEQIRNFAQHLIDVSNQAFENSHVDNVRYRLRHVSASTIADGQTAAATLDALYELPGLARAREAYGADTVILLTEQFTDWSAGMAYIQRTPGPEFAPFALGVVSRYWTLNDPVFTHETGHILGMEHDPDSAATPPGAGSFPWSFGHRTPAGEEPPPDPGFYTIMSYHHIYCGTPCESLLMFSNPEVVLAPEYGGQAAGVPDQRDNSRTARLLGAGNSAFYPETDAIFAAVFDDAL
jgi:hypothetical protein